MRIRSKLLLSLTALAILSVVALSLISYLRGASEVEARLRGEVERAARGIARDVGARLREREETLISLARSPALRSYVLQGAASSATSPVSAELPEAAKNQESSVDASSEASEADPIPRGVKSEVNGFLQSGVKHYVALTCLDAGRRPKFRAELGNGEDGQPIRFQMGDFYSESIRLNEKVWSVSEPDRKSTRLNSSHLVI